MYYVDNKQFCDKIYGTYIRDVMKKNKKKMLFLLENKK